MSAQVATRAAWSVVTPPVPGVEGAGGPLAYGIPDKIVADAWSRTIIATTNPHWA